MAHLIDETTGRAAMAFVGETPWHGLGQPLTPNQPIEVWTKEAGLDYDVLRSPVMFNSANHETMNTMSNRDVLYRSDTGAALSVVSKDYKIVQPSDVLGFFGKLAEVGGFELETAGALSDGKRIWALAKINDGAPIIGQDFVRPYILLATSYDGTLATTGKLTGIRVVCHNTITMALGAYKGQQVVGKIEADTEGKAVSSMIRIPHTNVFDPDDVRMRLGIVSNAWERWLVNTRILAETAISDQQAEDCTVKLLGNHTPGSKSINDIKKSSGYIRIMRMFDGEMIGCGLTEGKTMWRYLNAITEEVDWRRGKSNNTRMSSAWFGAGESMKNAAYQGLLELVKC